MGNSSQGFGNQPPACSDDSGVGINVAFVILKNKLFHALFERFVDLLCRKNLCVLLKF